MGGSGAAEPLDPGDDARRAPAVGAGGTGPSAALRLHRGGQFRRRLARAFGRDETEGDVLWRRILHGTGAFVLVYYLLPDDFFVVASKELVLLLALAAAFVLELARHRFGLELPTIRGYESNRPASFLFYSVGLVVAVLLFPEGIAAVVVVGTAFVDPIAGDLRTSGRSATVRLSVPIVVYAVLAAVALAVVGRWPLDAAVGLGALAAVVAVLVERWRFRWVDDDLTMTVVPAVVLLGAAVGLGLAR
jgi:dolichol kinase